MQNDPTQNEPSQNNPNQPRPNPEQATQNVSSQGYPAQSPAPVYSSANEGSISSQRPTKKILVITGIVVAWLVLGFGVFQHLHKPGSDAFSIGTFQPSFRDWLKPASEVKVGTNRYVDPCQALSVKDVQSVYGAFGDDGDVFEEYLDSTPPAKYSPAHLDCNYTVANKQVGSVELTAEEYRDSTNDSLRLPGEAFLLVDADTIDQTVAGYDSQVSKTHNADAQEFVKQLKTSAAVFKKYQDVYDPAEAPGLDMESIVIANDTSIHFVENNIIYQLRVSGIDKKLTSTPDGFAKQVANLKQLVATIRKHANDPSLSQSPVPTILGSSDKYGKTQILEPCAILTPAIFQEVIGKGQNDRIVRTTPHVNLAKERFARDKSIILPDHECERSYSNYNDEAADSADPGYSINFTLHYAASADQANAWLNGRYPSGKIQTLQTDADWAASMPLGKILDSESTAYVFRVGNYIGDVGVSGSQSAGLEDDVHSLEGTKDQHVKAINLLTASLKANLQKAQ